MSLSVSHQQLMNVGYRGFKCLRSELKHSSEGRSRTTSDIRTTVHPSPKTPTTRIDVGIATRRTIWERRERWNGSSASTARSTTIRPAPVSPNRGQVTSSNTTPVPDVYSKPKPIITVQ